MSRGARDSVRCNDALCGLYFQRPPERWWCGSRPARRNRNFRSRRLQFLQM